MPEKQRPGDAFVASVADGLRLAGYRVEREQLIGHKKADLVAKQLRWGRDWTIAVECKDYARPIGLKLVVDIWSHYEPLYTLRRVDEVLIVTRCGLAPAAIAYVHSRAGLAAQELRELVESSMDFRAYLLSAAEAIIGSADGVGHYYVPPTVTGGASLESIVTDWIHHEPSEADALSGRPLAVLGSYGSGKSSFATYTFSALARTALIDPQARIPVLIRLSDFSGEQTLEGLLGKHFTATHVVPGYAFDTFQALNRLGRFVIILDGFDEMRQALSWRSFQYNLSQLNRLHSPSARLLILGRPTAFETDEEYQLAIHGKRAGRRRLDVDATWPDYVDFEIAPLEVDQIHTFVRQYLLYLSGLPVNNSGTLEDLLLRITSPHLFDIAKRPVQLRMLCEILPDYTGDLAALDVAQVYDMFIDQLIDGVISREEEKLSRLAFSSAARRRFLEAFAYWLWRQPRRTLATIQEVPDELVAPFANGDDLETVRRDLLIGAPLDRRMGEHVRFPHRSFQEFLVASEVWRRLSDRSLSLAEADSFTSPEIADFMHLMRGEQEYRAARHLMFEARGCLSLRLIRAVFLSPNAAARMFERLDDSGSRRSTRFGPWELLTLFLWTESAHEGSRVLRPEDVEFIITVSHNDLVELGLFILLKLPNGLQTVGALFDRMLRRIGHSERLSLNDVRLRNIKPVGSDLVAEFGDDNRVQFGRCSSKSLVVDSGKGPLLTGGNRTDVLWLSDFMTHVALSSAVSGDALMLDLDRLARVFADRLPSLAFVTDWLDDSGLRDGLLPHGRRYAKVAIGRMATDVSELQNAIAEAQRLQQKGSTRWG